MDGITRKERAVRIIEELGAMFTDPKAADELLGYCAAPFIKAPELPSSKYSFGNQLLLYSQKADDVRGFTAWKNVNRHVKKGAKAVWILAPRKIKVEDDDGETHELNTGFRAVPVYRLEDTEGDPLPEYKPKSIPPLTDLAEKNGLRIKYDNTRRGEEGYYSNARSLIVLCNEDPVTYFHEMIHHYDRIMYNNHGNLAEKEAVAEFGACVVAKLYGIDNTKNSWSYIAKYAGENSPEAVGRLCSKIYERVARIITRMLEDAEK